MPLEKYLIGVLSGTMGGGIQLQIIIVMGNLSIHFVSAKTRSTKY